MDELSAIRIFITVAEASSFSGAGRQLDMSTSSVSRQIRALEEYIDVRLFKRTTRNIVLTEAGEAYLRSVMPAVHGLELARRIANEHQDKVSGLIKLHARASAGTEVIVPALSSFFKLYPEIEIDLTLTDDRFDLLSNGVDLAVWLGKLDDSSMVARELSGSKRLVCGSPAYLNKFGVPESPQDLAKHNCLLYLKHNYSKVWHFTKGDDSFQIPVSGPLRTPDSAVLMAGVRQGLGLALLQHWMVRDLISSGQLKTVLTDYEVSPTEQQTSLYVVYPHRERIPQKVRVMIEFLVKLFDSNMPKNL